MKKLAMVPMLTINKLVMALNAIRMASDDKRVSAEANLGLIWVIANETLIEVAPEIENIKATAT